MLEATTQKQTGFSYMPNPLVVTRGSAIKMIFRIDLHWKRGIKPVDRTPSSISH